MIQNFRLTTNICVCNREISAPATPILESQLSSPFNLPQGLLGDAPQFPSLESQVAEALIRMKYSTQMLSQAYPSDEIDSLPQSPMALDLPGLLSFAPSASCSAVPEICNPDSDNWAPATSVIADSDKSIPSSKASQKRKPRVPKVDTVKFVLKHLHDARISLMDLLFTILSGDDFDWYRLRFLSDSRRINDLLNLLWNNKKSKPIFGDWFKDHGIDHICNLVSLLAANNSAGCGINAKCNAGS